MTETMERTWTQVGAAYSTPERRPQVERAIEELEWHEMPEGGSLSTPFMPGESINAAIVELGLPRVSAIAWNGALEFAVAGERDREYPGLYGIECNYRNGRCRLYVVDTGISILPVASDFAAN